MVDFDIRKHFIAKKVLDSGQIELIDGMVCDPLLKIVNAARVSFAKETNELTDKDIRLIRYLQEHGHTSTLRHSFFSFRVKAPLCVFRQWWKYQISSDWVENENIGTIEIPSTNWNEASGRYVEFIPDFYIPETIRKQSKSSKQGSEGCLDSPIDGLDPVEFFKQSTVELHNRYQAMVAAGAAKEQARMILPQNIYTECIWTPGLQTLIYFLNQRLKPDAQYEIRQYALALKEIMQPILGPILEAEA